MQLGRYHEEFEVGAVDSLLLGMSVADVSGHSHGGEFPGRPALRE